MAKKGAGKYRPPGDWLSYDASALIGVLAEAEAAVFALNEAPWRRDWLERIQEVQPEAEITGSGGAEDFEGDESDATPSGEVRRARNEATAQVCRWITTLPDDIPVDTELVSTIHRKLLAAPGQLGDRAGTLRVRGEKASIGPDRLRGARGGRTCSEALEALLKCVAPGPDGHPPLVKALAAHYHLISIQPFPGANGRTARALEALLRRPAGPGPHCKVGMSSFYLAEGRRYWEAIARSRHAGHDLTFFLDFALTGLKDRCTTILHYRNERLSIALFENTMMKLFPQLGSGKKEAMSGRQMEILRLLLEELRIPTRTLYTRIQNRYQPLKSPWKAFLRDVQNLLEIGAVRETGPGSGELEPQLQWPAEITEKQFLEHYSQSPRLTPPLVHSG